MLKPIRPQAGAEKEEVMREILNGVFANQMQAAGAVEALDNAGLVGKTCLIAQTSSTYATATLPSNKLSRSLFTFALLGALTGCLAGFIALPHFPSREVMYLVMVPLSGAFTGMSLGFLAVIGFNQFARLQETADSTIYLGDVHDGDITVSVCTNSGAQSERASRLLAEHGARHLAIGSVPKTEAEPTAINNAFQLGKTA